MTTRRQKIKAVVELTSREFEAPIAENVQPEKLVAGPSKSPKIQAEKFDEIKTSLRKEIMSDLTKILAENKKKMLKLILLLLNYQYSTNAWMTPTLKRKTLIMQQHQLL